MNDIMDTINRYPDELLYKPIWHSVDFGLRMWYIAQYMVGIRLFYYQYHCKIRRLSLCSSPRPSSLNAKSIV